MEAFKPPCSLSIAGNASENWKIFRQKFEIYLKASEKEKKPDETKIAMLLNAVGDEGFYLYNTFELPEDDKKKFQAVLDAFERYCSPRKNVVFNRFNFFNRIQQDGELFDHFATDLKKLAKDCEFEQQETSLIRDRIIIGIRDISLQEKLLQESDLKLEQATELCRAHEASKQQARVLQDASASVVGCKGPEVIVIHKKRQADTSENVNFYDCRRCGTKHGPRSCPAFNEKCKTCGRVGHFAVGCYAKNSRKLKYKQSRRVKVEEMVGSSEESEGEDSNFLMEQINLVHEINYHNKRHWLQDLSINGHSVTFKLDTGADANGLPFKIFKKVCPNKMLCDTSSKLVAFGGHKIPIMGMTDVNCKLDNNKKHQVKFIVVDMSNVNPILGLQSCIELNLIKRVETLLSENNQEKQQFVERNKDVFEGLGRFPFEYTIKLKDGAVPTIKPVRRLPDIIKKKLKPALEKMEKSGVISKVTEATDWVNDLVIVEKKNGSLRVCLNPADLNKSIKREYYQIPTTKELTAELPGKKICTVLDMKDGFHQIPLSEESSKLCTFGTPFGRYKFNRLPFGLSSSPEVFQRENIRLFGDIL